MKKPVCYVETSVWNAPFSDDAPEFQSMAIAFFKRASEFDITISPLVLIEIERCPDHKRSLMLSLLKDTPLEILPLTVEVDDLMKRYMEYMPVFKKYAADAGHIAVASISNVDFIISLNFEHIVRERTRNLVTAVNSLYHYRTPHIISPGEI